MVQIKPLTGLNFKDIYKAFNEAFSDYDAPSMYFEQLHQMVTRRGFDPEISFGAFEDEKLVSFTLNGKGNWNGEPTAYDTGTGTIKEYRGRGLAKEIFQFSMPVLKENGLTQYLLEVMQTNDKAVNLYKNQGFDVVREFDYYLGDKKDIVFNETKLSKQIEIRDVLLKEIEKMALKPNLTQSWQNSLDSIKRGIEYFKCIGAYDEDKLVGYAISETNTGDITQLFVAENSRRNKVGTQLLKNLFEKIPDQSFKVINVDKKDKVMASFLSSLNIVPVGSQFEMTMSID